MSSTPYPYLILGLETTATAEDVEKAYKQKVLKYHPDKFKKDMDDKKRHRYLEKFRAITQARDDILKELEGGPSSTSLDVMNPFMEERTLSPRKGRRRGHFADRAHPPIGLFGGLFDLGGLDEMFEAVEQRMQHSMKIMDDTSAGSSSPHGIFYSRTEVFKNDNGRTMRSIQENNNGTIRNYDEVDGRRVNPNQLRH
jgi:hypothetical protein